MTTEATEAAVHETSSIKVETTSDQIDTTDVVQTTQTSILTARPYPENVQTT